MRSNIGVHRLGIANHPLLEKTHQRLKRFSHVTPLADRGFANHDLVRWLKRIHWHWYIRLPGDTTIHYRQGRHHLSREVRQMVPPKGEARFYRQVKLWDDGELESHLALAHLKGVKEACSTRPAPFFGTKI